MLIIKILAPVIHITEEQWLGSFRAWFNKLWGFSENSNVPLDATTNKIRNTWGLGVALIGLVLYGGPALVLYLGFIAADTVQHIGLSILPWSRRRAGLSPGWITSFLYLYLVLSEFSLIRDYPVWAIIGAAGLGLTYVEAWWKIKMMK